MNITKSEVKKMSYQDTDNTPLAIHLNINIRVLSRINTFSCVMDQSYMFSTYFYFIHCIIIFGKR